MAIQISNEQKCISQQIKKIFTWSTLLSFAGNECLSFDQTTDKVELLLIRVAILKSPI